MNICWQRALAISLLLSWPALVTAEAMLAISESWVREAPPTARVMAAYMTMINTGDTPVTVTSVSSPDFEGAEIHQTVVENEVARMLAVKQLEIPAGNRLALEPGGLHLMLFDPRRPLPEGATVTLTIHHGDNGQVTTKAAVIRKTGEDHSHHHH